MKLYLSDDVFRLKVRLQVGLTSFPVGGAFNGHVPESATGHTQYPVHQFAIHIRARCR